MGTTVVGDIRDLFRPQAEPPLFKSFWALWRGAASISTTNLTVPLLTLWFIVFVSATTLNLFETYVWLGVITVLILLVASVRSKRDLFNIHGFTYRDAVPAIAFGAAAIGSFMLIYMLVTLQFVQNPGSINELWSAFVINVLIIAPVEELFFRWAIPMVWKVGALLSVPVFAFEHPIIRETLLTSGITPLTVGAFFFLMAVAMGLQSVTFLGMLKWRGRKLFGLPTAIGMHAAYNALVVLFALTLFGVPLVVM